MLEYSDLIPLSFLFPRLNKPSSFNLFSPIKYFNSQSPWWPSAEWVLISHLFLNCRKPALCVANKLSPISDVLNQSMGFFWIWKFHLSLNLGKDKTDPLLFPFSLPSTLIFLYLNILQSILAFTLLHILWGLENTYKSEILLYIYYPTFSTTFILLIKNRDIFHATHFKAYWTSIHNLF